MLLTPQLADVVKGPVIGPSDTEYDRARSVFLGSFDRRPSAIVRVADAADVARVIELARDTGAELAVRSGGHSPAGHSGTEGGVVIDMRGMRALEIDARRRVAWADAGLTAREYTIAAGKRGLANGFGDTGTVGIGGITLAGGIGFLVRKHGLTVDDVLAAEIVTANGEVLYTDAERHPDLFWALRGGGGNLGVVTGFRFRMHPIETVVGGALFLPATPEVVAGFVAEAEAAPDELSTVGNVMTAPPLPFLPAELHGRPVVRALICYAGDVADGERVIGRFRALAPPLADTVRPIPYPQMYGDEPDDYHPVAVSRTMFVDAVDAGDAETILARLEQSTASIAVCQLRVLGGAMANVPENATAFAHRRRRIMATVGAIYEQREEREAHEAWVTGLASALHQGDRAAYVGFLGDEGPERVRAAYPAATWERLAAVKATYDPDNVFRLNQNVPPAP